MRGAHVPRCEVPGCGFARAAVPLVLPFFESTAPFASAYTVRHIKAKAVAHEGKHLDRLRADHAPPRAPRHVEVDVRLLTGRFAGVPLLSGDNPTPLPGKSDAHPTARQEVHTMQPLIDNARLFGQCPEKSARIEGQTLQMPFITCSGSRVVPPLITGARPAELFEPRTAGNAVPPFVSVIPTGRHCEVPSGNVRGHRMEPGTLESVQGS